MNQEDRKRYFIVGSVILEIVAPLLKKRLETDYQSQGFKSLEDFINSSPVIHILFHLRQRNVKCCIDRPNCVNNQSLPLNYCQWDQLYKEKPGTSKHHCHCKYTAKSIQLIDLDITLVSLILLNCCILGSADQHTVTTLRQYKNDYLSHNVKGGITENEYTTLWSELTKYVLQLDSSKKDDIVRIENRSLDESLCIKYSTSLLDVHEKLDEMSTSIQENKASIQELVKSVQKLDNLVNDSMNTLNASVLDVDQSVKSLNNTLHVSLQSLNTPFKAAIQTSNKSANCHTPLNKQGYSQLTEPYKLGQDIFYLHKKYDLRSFSSSELSGIDNGHILDDGRLVLCMGDCNKVLICSINMDGLLVETINFENKPLNITEINTSKIAVVFHKLKFIDIYNPNNKAKLKSIPLPGHCCGLTAVNNHLVVGGHKTLWIVDHETGELIKAIAINYFILENLYASDNQIFYCGYLNKLHCFHYPVDKVLEIYFPSLPRRMTVLQDGSLYVDCQDHSVQHVSDDRKQYEKVTTKGLNSKCPVGAISYNSKQRKLLKCSRTKPIVYVFHEI